MRIFSILLFFVTFTKICFAATTTDFTRIYDSVFAVYKQNQNGTLESECTATVFNKVNNKYSLLTAAHCVIDKDDIGFSYITKVPLFVTLDESDEKAFIRAEIEKVGNARNGYDLAILSIETNKLFPVLKIGNETLENEGTPIINVAVPFGIGKTCFRGFIAKTRVNRPLANTEEKLDWARTMLVQVPVFPGSSGSAIICNNAIIGVVVGLYNGLPITMPISRLSEQNEDSWLKK